MNDKSRSSARSPFDRGPQLGFVFEGPLALLTVNEVYEKADQSLLERLKEDKRIERKPSGFHARALGDYFSMWANTQPEGGLVAIGVANDGTLLGCNSLSQTQINDLERTSMVYCSDARYEMKRIPVQIYYKEDFIILFRVFFRQDKVVTTSAGDAFTRVGDSKKKLSAEEIRELQIDKKQVDFEREPINLNYPEDFDADLIGQYVESYRAIRGLTNEHSDEQILELTHLGKYELGNFTPNVACTMLFAKDPASTFPGCKIRFLRFDGEYEGTGETFNPEKDIWIEGPVPRQIEQAEHALNGQLRNFSRLGPDQKFYTAPEYPKTAWYEAIVNACVHRSYGLRAMNIFIKMFDDRLVIESPGGFPPFVTPDNIYQMHHPRNPYLMEAMFYLKFVKCAAEGTRRIRDAMIEMSLPGPEFEQKETGNVLVRVTLRNNKKQRKAWLDAEAGAVIGEALAKTLTIEERRAINWIVEHGSISVSEVQRLTSKTWPAAKKILTGLETRGILECRRKAKLERDPGARFFLKNRIDNPFEGS